MKEGAGRTLWRSHSENVSALKVSKVPFPVFGGEVRVVKENGKSQSLGVNTRCCQTRGREREGVAEDLTFVVIVVYLIEWVGLEVTLKTTSFQPPCPCPKPACPCSSAHLSWALLLGALLSPCFAFFLHSLCSLHHRGL